MNEQANTPETTETDALTIYQNRPLVMDETPVDDGSITINMWVRRGDELATMRVTEFGSDEDEHGEEFETTTEIDSHLVPDELFDLAMTAGKALRALGKLADLTELIKGLTDELFESLK